MKSSDCYKCKLELSACPSLTHRQLSDECLHNRYVYVYHRLPKGAECTVPYYVGKGSIRRVFGPHDRIKRPTKCADVHILGKRMSDVDARQAEILLIYLYGRKCNKTGPLLNLSEGGDSPATFHVTKDMSGYHYTATLSDDRFYASNPDFYLLTSYSGGWMVPNKFPRLLLGGRWVARKEH